MNSDGLWSQDLETKPVHFFMPVIPLMSPRTSELLPPGLCQSSPAGEVGDHAAEAV